MLTTVCVDGASVDGTVRWYATISAGLLRMGFFSGVADVDMGSVGAGAFEAGTVAGLISGAAAGWGVAF
jgi:hypothetical protein